MLTRTFLARIFALFCFFVLGLGLPVEVSLATDYTSPSFIVRDPVIGQGGSEDAASGSFKVGGTTGEAANGASSGSTFATQGGTNYQDETAPVGGSVNDGVGADIDSQSAMDALSANWTGFTDPESGIQKYAYRLQRLDLSQCWSAATPGWTSCDVWNDVASATTVTVNDVALAIRTGTDYVFCVRATNNANLTADAVCSDGLHIDPSLTLSFDSSSVALPELAPSNGWGSTGSTVITVVTNAFDGYVVYGSKSHLLNLLADTSQSFPDVSDGGCNGSAVSWPGATHFGFTSSDDVDSNKFAGGTKYCAFPTTTNPALGVSVADRTANVTGGQVTDTHTITYKTQATTTQAAGQYRTDLFYTVLARY